MKTCPNCKRELPDGAKFCVGCGAPVAEPTPAAETVEPQAAAKKKSPKKAILICGIAVAILAALITAAVLLCKGSKAVFALYVKDDEVFLSDLTGDQPRQITERLFADLDFEGGSWRSFGYALEKCIQTDQSGKYIFFPDRISEEDGGINLYYRRVDRQKEEAVKIDSCVLAYTVDPAGTLVTYVKGEEGSLYQYSIARDAKDKIATDVSSYYISEDAKTLWFANRNGNLYLKQGNGEKEKLASEIADIEYVTQDRQTVYYTKDGALYRQTAGADKMKVASDIADVLRIYDSGEVYYTKKESNGILVKDCVTDDTKDADAALTEPETPVYPDEPAYPYWWDYGTDAAYEAAYAEYETAYAAWEAACGGMREAYDAACETYQAKTARDAVRARMDDTLDAVLPTAYALFYYDGSAEVCLTEAFKERDAAAQDAPVLVFVAYDRPELEKVKLSAVTSLSDVVERVNAAWFSVTTRYIAVKGAAVSAEEKKEAQSFTVSPDGTAVYYIDDVPDDKDYGELYRIPITDGEAGTPEVYDNDVYNGRMWFLAADELLYFKDVKDYSGDLFVNKKRIDSEVELYDGVTLWDDGRLFYSVDRSDDNATLKVYDGKKTEKIADDVYAYRVTDRGVLYLYDYSTTSGTGELRLWKNGRAKKMDEDVRCLLVGASWSDDPYALMN